MLQPFDATGTSYQFGLKETAEAQAHAGDVDGALTTAARIDFKDDMLTNRDDVLGGIALSLLLRDVARGLGWMRNFDAGDK